MGLRLPVPMARLATCLLPGWFAITAAAGAPGSPPAESEESVPWQALAPLLPPDGEGGGAPEALALDALGRLFVLDRGRGRIYRASQPGEWLEFGAGEQGGTRWPQITGISARPGPDLLALDAASGRLFRFDLEGRLRATFAWRDEAGELGSIQPADFGLTPSGELLLLDRDEGRLLLFDRSGRLLTDLASGLTGPRRPRSPTQIDLDMEGRIYVLDPPGARVLRFTRQGEALSPWEYGEGLGTDAGQALLAVRPDGSVVIVSRLGSWARICDASGRRRHEWRSETPLRFPLTDAAATDTLVYLACPGGGCVLRWRLPDSGDDGHDLQP